MSATRRSQRRVNTKENDNAELWIYPKRYGEVENNYGKVENNYGKVENNYGKVENNYGKVKYNKW